VLGVFALKNVMITIMILFMEMIKMKKTTFDLTGLYLCCKKCNNEVTYCYKCEKVIEIKESIYCSYSIDAIDVHLCQDCVE